MARAPDGSTPIEKHRFKAIAELFIISIGKRGVGGRGGVRLIHRTENRALVLFLENGTAPFEKCKQSLEQQHFLLLRDIWCSKFIFKCC